MSKLKTDFDLRKIQSTRFAEPLKGSALLRFWCQAIALQEQSCPNKFEHGTRALDTVRYKLEIAIDPEFSFVNTTDSILTSEYTVEDSLTFGTHYCWRVTAWDKDGLTTVSWNTPDFWTWKLGDLDHSHDVNVADLTLLVDVLFQGGTPPYPWFIVDIDGDCTVNISDLTFLVAYLFTGGPDPAIGCGPELPSE